MNLSYGFFYINICIVHFVWLIFDIVTVKIILSMCMFYSRWKNSRIFFPFDRCVYFFLFSSHFEIYLKQLTGLYVVKLLIAICQSRVKKTVCALGVDVEGLLWTREKKSYIYHFTHIILGLAV